MIERDKDGNILYYQRPFEPIYHVDRTDVSTPKQYGMKLLNRKRGRK